MLKSLSEKFSEALGYPVQLLFSSYLKCPNCGTLQRFEIVSFMENNALEVSGLICNHTYQVESDLEPQILVHRIKKGTQK
jgi:hypothetical protein